MEGNEVESIEETRSQILLDSEANEIKYFMNNL